MWQIKVHRVTLNTFHIHMERALLQISFTDSTTMLKMTKQVNQLREYMTDTQIGQVLAVLCTYEGRRHRVAQSLNIDYQDLV